MKHSRYSSQNQVEEEDWNRIKIQRKKWLKGVRKKIETKSSLWIHFRLKLQKIGDIQSWCYIFYLLSLFLAHMSTQLQHHWFIDNSRHFSKKTILECWKKKLTQFLWKKREKQHKNLRGSAMWLHPQKRATNGFTIRKIGFTTYLFYPYWKLLT